MTTQTQAPDTPTHTLKATYCSSSSTIIPSGPITSTLNFYSPPTDGSKPHNYVEAAPAGQAQRNFSDEAVSVTIQDVRGQESAFSLNEHGFEAVSSVPMSREKDFEDAASIERNYYPEVEKVLLEHVRGAKRILLFDHTIRRASSSAKRAPVTRVHIDQTAASAAARVRYHLPAAEAHQLLQGRVRIVNVWRPINGAVETFPLAFADSRSVPDDAIVGVEHRYPDRVGETAAVKFTRDAHRKGGEGEGMHGGVEEGQRWWYWSGVGNDERILLQCYDNRGTGARLPHTAFVDPRSGVGAKPRESIEVRALVFG